MGGTAEILPVTLAGLRIDANDFTLFDKKAACARRAPGRPLLSRLRFRPPNRQRWLLIAVGGQPVFSHCFGKTNYVEQSTEHSTQ